VSICPSPSAQQQPSQPGRELVEGAALVAERRRAAVGQLVVEAVIAELGGDVGVAARQVVKVILGQPPEPHGGIPGRPGRGGLCTHVYSSRGHDCLCEPPRTCCGERAAWPTGLTRWRQAEAGSRPVSASSNGEDRGNAFAADNSTEWTGGTRNLASETGLDDKTIRSYLFALRHGGPGRSGLGTAAS